VTQRWKLTIEYDGTDFAGWQRQDNALGVQQAIEQSIRTLTGEDTVLTVAGRTDAGVHATGQVAHVDIEKNLDAKNVRDGINFHLRPYPVSIIQADPVAAEFHARFDAICRVYCYRILMNRPSEPVIGGRYVWHVWKNLDIDAMNAGAKHLLGLHDFTSFRAAECQAKSAVRSIERLEWLVNDRNLNTGVMIELWAEARSFLHHQIRNIAGTLKMVGEGKMQPDDIKDIRDARDRTRAGVTAPASGLHFIRVDY
jgi:tRNA pseudouridine38-40 synthase